MLSRIFQLFLIAGLATSPLQAATDPFVGQWKLVKLTDRMQVTKAGGNTYTFDFGGGAENIVVDGTFQPGYGGTTLSVAPDGPNWKVVRKKDDRVLLTATWSLSQDGNMLHDDFTSFGQDGSPSNVKYVYERKSAGTGFEGTWVTSATVSNSGTTLRISPYQSDGLTFFAPAQNQTRNVTFDGKSARRLNAHSVEISIHSQGEPVQTRRYDLSPDLKTLTMTVHLAGIDQPYVYVFERQ